MATDSPTPLKHSRGNTTLRAASLILGAVALIELILATIALTPKFVSGIRITVASSANPVNPTPPPLPTSGTTPSPVALPPGTVGTSEAPAPTSIQQQTDSIPPVTAPVDILRRDKPRRQPPADSSSPGGSSLQIVTAHLAENDDGTKKLQIAIKANPGEQIDAALEKVQVFFYDDDGGEIVASKAQVTSKWLNWQNGEPQLVEVSYLPDSVDQKIKFAGYVIAIYYKGDLQDCRSEPSKLQKLFEPKYYIGNDE
jgi:hypothetical protein